MIFVSIIFLCFCYSVIEKIRKQRDASLLPHEVAQSGSGLQESSTAVPSTFEPGKDVIECSRCKLLVSKRYYASHLKSSLHKSNILRLHDKLSNVYLIDSAFGQRVVTYRITHPSSLGAEFQTPESFLNDIKSTVLNLIDDCIKTLTLIKINFILHADLVQESKSLENSFDFQTVNNSICIGDDYEATYQIIMNDICNKISEFEKKDSGWSLKKIRNIDLNVNKFNPLRGSSYIDLPIDIKHKKAIINVKNNDVQCFKWAVLSALYPVTKNSDRVSSYIHNQNKLKFEKISFPVKLKDIHKFEEFNNLSINVFGLEYNAESRCNRLIGPLYFTKRRKLTHINLLYINSGSRGHYCYIKCLSKLLHKQINRTHRAIHICDGCLMHYPSKKCLDQHQHFDCVHICTDLPDPMKTKKNWFNVETASNKLAFNNYERKLKLPFVIYADFEAFLTPIQTCQNEATKSYTNNIQKHAVFSFGYYLKCSYNDSLSIYRTYTGERCAEQFMKHLKGDLELICKENSFPKPPLPLSESDNLHVLQSKVCYICNNDLDNNNNVICYDWYSGKYAGVAHTCCKKKYKAPRFVPVFLHNLANYDAHFIVHALGFEEGKIDIIPQNKEKYISFSKYLKIKNNNISLRFLDSFKFMSSSLDRLAHNIKTHQFVELKKNYPRDEDFKRLIRKGVYPYEIMTSFESLKISSLPTQNQFFNSLVNTNVSNDDYRHAQDVWNHFKCGTMDDYTSLYLKTDVLLLTDVFENFRNICMKTYDLDPAHYYTAPGLSWDAMLKSTMIELELLTDFDKIAFIKKGIRGGISQCSNRYAKANNKFMEDYDSKLQSSYLVYLDANNLYGWAMSQPLPIGDFEWVDVNVDFNIANDAEYGYILEVDLQYPVDIHDSHSDLPFCSENISIGGSREKKLVPNLKDKKKYIIHYRNLKQCIDNGLHLHKIHRVLKFKQRAWLSKYIDLNTKMRSTACTEFDKDFYKLMNNSVFGKTMENIEKRVNVKLLTHWSNNGGMEGAQSLISKPEFHSLSIFSENLVAVQLNKTKLYYNKPIYLGFCILDISKTLIYDFHYSFMKNKFKENLKLLYTDTDSLIYQIFTEDFYNDIKIDLDRYFDTSDYPPNNPYGFPLINKKKIGLFKDENNGMIFKEFVGLRSKMYAMDVGDKFIAKAKGVNKSVTKSFQIKDYKDCLFKKRIKMDSMIRFKSIKHIIYTQKNNKVSLSHNDSKRYLIENSTDTLAWGHYKLQ